MIAFWLAGAALAAAVLAVALRPWWFGKRAALVSRREANVSIYRDQLRELEADLRAGTLAQADYERARRELESRALADEKQDEKQDRAPAAKAGRRLAWAVGAGIPVAALAVYVAVGSPGALSPQADPHAVTAQQLEGMIERLAARLRENPDDADVLAMARGQRLEGEPEKLILRALEIEPTNLKGLALAGTAAFHRKDYAGAAAYWEKMLPLVPPESEDARVIRGNVQEARALAGAPPAGSAPKAAAAKGALRGKVLLSAKLKQQASPEDTVFIFARAAEGPPMPLAVKRVKVRELPAAFALDDSMAMAPGMTLSAHPRVVVVARVSRSGKAGAEPGDLEGSSAPVANNAEAVNVVIDRVVR